jgi:Kdo2-lipid IVA lauroyltransferase/acyltransferase
MSRRPRPHLLHPACWPAWLAVALLRLLVLLPLAAQRRAGLFIGDAMRILARSRRRIVATNLALCFPELAPAMRETLLRENFRAWGLGMVEAAAGWWSSAARLQARSTVQGLELLQQARAQGQGVLLIGMHMSDLELAGCSLALHGELDMVYRRQQNPVWDRVMRRGREARFARVIERADTRALLRSLRQGRPVWYLPDQDFGARHSLFAPFFGVPAATLTATTRVLRLGKAQPLLFTHHRHDDGMHHVLRISEFPPSYPVRDEELNVQQFNRVVEQAVRAHAGQYLWAHRRFKTRPPGVAFPYKKDG